MNASIDCTKFPAAGNLRRQQSFNKPIDGGAFISIRLLK
jgi:hypothetical protein